MGCTGVRLGVFPLNMQLVLTGTNKGYDLQLSVDYSK